MTLRNAPTARVRLIVWCKAYRHQVEPDRAKMARRHGPEAPVPGWQKRLVCSSNGSHNADIVVTGERWRNEETPVGDRGFISGRSGWGRTCAIVLTRKRHGHRRGSALAP
jgi:hypothetical protein